MKSLTLLIFACILAVVMAEGQFYVPRSYYIIDSDGHESIPVPLRRLKRSINRYMPLPYNNNANAEANAYAYNGGSASAKANAWAGGGGGGEGSQPQGFSSPLLSSFASNGNVPLSPRYSYGYGSHLGGPIYGARSVYSSSSADLGSDGQGYYDNYAAVH